MSSKLQLLERQLGRAAAGASVPENAASSMMASYKAEVDRTAEAAIKAADVKRNKAEEECAGLIAQLSELSRDSTFRQKELQLKMDSFKDVAKQETEALCSKHKGDMAQMQAQVDALRGQVATERQDKVRAQTQMEAAKETCARLEQMVEKLQSAKPVAVATPKAVARKPLKIRVTQRDENGRIIELSEV